MTQPQSLYQKWVTTYATIEEVAVELKEISEGWTVAGSCGRYDDACFAVHFDVRGARHGRRFHNTPQGMDNAEKYFEMITK